MRVLRSFVLLLAFAVSMSMTARAAPGDVLAHKLLAAQIQAAGLAPSDARGSTIMATLPPGAYTAITSGVGGATGVGVVAVYRR